MATEDIDYLVVVRGEAEWFALFSLIVILAPGHLATNHRQQVEKHQKYCILVIEIGGENLSRILQLTILMFN